MIDVNKLKDYKYVSFDIFDTLIKRNCSNPHKVFEIVQNQYNNNNNTKEKIYDFYKKRIDSENEARKISNEEEVSLDDIYTYLENYYSKYSCKILKEIEINVELDICQKNHEMDNILEYCIKNDKKIIITSDMYLNKSIIEKILKKNNIEYYKLFLSSDLKVTKYSGKLFLAILKDLKIKNTELIHIGDNYKSDYLIPKKLGIASINYIVQKHNDYNKKIKDNLDSSILSTFIQNNFIENKKQFYDWGYSCFGPILYGFNQWLLKQLKKEGINKVYFMARDGYIMKKAFDSINSETEIKSYYLYASRRSIIVPSLWNCKDISEIYDLMYLGNKVKLSNFLKMIGLEEYDLHLELREYNLDLNKEYSLDYMKNDTNFCSFMEKIFDKIITNSKKEYKCMQKYLQKLEFYGKVAIVDIGWHGNMQLALSKIVDNAIYGYYVGLHPKNANQKILKMEGFLFDRNHGESIYPDINRNTGIFEFLFLARHGSVKCFNDSEEMVEFYNYEYEDSYEQKISENIQKGAIDFVKNMNSACCKEYIDFKPIVCINNFLHSIDKPNKKVLETFGSLKFLDNEILYAADAKSLGYYFLHPKNFVNDFRKSVWRIGFLNKIIYMKNVNYYLGILVWNLMRKLKKE